MGDIDKKITLNQFKYLLNLDKETFYIRIYKGESPRKDKYIESFYWSRKVDTPRTIDKMIDFFHKYGNEEIDSISILMNELFINIIIVEDKLKDGK